MLFAALIITLSRAYAVCFAASGIPGMTPAQVDETVSMLVSMGFPDADARVALRAAFGNADRAVEYLMTGIPDSGAHRAVL